MNDLIIIGAGPSGMTAAVYAARKKLDALLISKNVGGQAMWSSEVENYLGYTYISGQELVEKFEEHVNKFNIAHEYDNVSRLEKNGEVFKAVTDGGKEFVARAVIIATGKIPRKLGVRGEEKFVGRGMMYCATCDAPMFADMDVAVVGGGNAGLDAAIQLIKIATKVTVIEFADRLKADEVFISRVRQADNASILLNTAIKQVLGEKFVQGIVVENRGTGEKREIPVKGVFVEIGSTPAVEFAKGLVEMNAGNEILVNCACETSVPGLFAAGDVTSVPEKQIIIAAGEGAKAALSAYSYLVRSENKGV